MCEECKTCHVRTGRLVLAGQCDLLFVPSVMKTHTPLTDDPAQEEVLLQRYQERVERLSQQDRVIKICSDAGFLTTVEVGQYFIVSTLCHEMKNQPTRKVGFEGIPKLAPHWKSQPASCKVNYGVEIRIESVNKDNSHSWVRISHGLNKLVTNLNNKDGDNNEQEISEMQFEDCAFKTKILAFASRTKAKAKPQRRISVSSSTKTVPTGERSWTVVEPQEYSSIDYPVSKQLITLLRHGNLPREEDGAIEFWRLKEYLRNDFVRSHQWSDEMRKSTMAKGGNKKIFQYCTDPSGQEILYLRALQGHSGRNPIDPSLQDNVLIPNDFSEYIYHIG